MNNKYVQQFIEHPDWRHVEDLILTYAETLKNMEDIDTTECAEDVKAEVIGRLKAYETFIKFINDSKLVGRQLKEKTTFK